MSRILACGDNHIGKSRDLYPERLSEQEQVWRDTLRLARERECDLVLHAGDLWEKRRPQPDEYLTAERPLIEHRDQGGCQVVLVAGNHDRSGVADDLALDVLAEAGLITLAKTPKVIYEAWPAIACLPWTPVSRLVAASGGGDRDEIHRQAADYLIETARELRASITKGSAILLAHWSVSGASLPSGLDVAALRETVLPAADLANLGYDAVVLGHIHKPQTFIGVSDYGAGQVGFYVGSPQPLDFGEGGCEHGYWLLETDPVFAEFVPLVSRRFLTIDPAEEADPFAVPGAIIRVRGTAQDLNAEEIRQTLTFLGAHHVASISLDVERAERPERAEISDDLGPLEALQLYLESQSPNGKTPALVERARAYLEGVA